MKTAKEIGEILFYHQDANEAIVRAMNLPENQFAEWSAKNPLLTAYAMGSCEVYFPMLIVEEVDDKTIAQDLIWKFLYDAINPISKDIKREYHEYFTRYQN
jgi:hypothetical protein